MLRLSQGEPRECRMSTWRISTWYWNKNARAPLEKVKFDCFVIGDGSSPVGVYEQPARRVFDHGNELPTGNNAVESGAVFPPILIGLTNVPFPIAFGLFFVQMTHRIPSRDARIPGMNHDPARRSRGVPTSSRNSAIRRDIEGRTKGPSTHFAAGHGTAGAMSVWAKSLPL